ncbi:hypothetical protein NC652_024740 [Populus alba x Populus x berolinensis]|nr:hypothetical protein NC652_024736 [Populus alba x Populus x berolinensis]KAJ6898008.1 hypothetical protein NC652_024740 [Populus alba x Populus x berolinensis]
MVCKKWIHVDSFDQNVEAGGNCTDQNESCERWAALAERTKNTEHTVGSPDLPGHCRRSCKMLMHLCIPLVNLFSRSDNSVLKRPVSFSSEMSFRREKTMLFCSNGITMVSYHMRRISDAIFNDIYES